MLRISSSLQPAACCSARSARVMAAQQPIAIPRVQPSTSQVTHAQRIVCRVAQPRRVVEAAMDDFEGLSEDEDFEIPGNFLEAMSSNTPLGKALREACKELDHLGGVELEIMNSYDSALAKLGVKSRVAATRTAPQPEEEEEEEAAPRAV